MNERTNDIKLVSWKNLNYFCLWIKSVLLMRHIAGKGRENNYLLFFPVPIISCSLKHFSESLEPFKNNWRHWDWRREVGINQNCLISSSSRSFSRKNNYRDIIEWKEPCIYRISYLNPDISILYMFRNLTFCNFDTLRSLEMKSES